MNIIDYWEAGFRVFGLHAINAEGKCSCGDEDCESAGKHPFIRSWQNIPHWCDEQIETVAQYQCDTGFGVCVDNHLVIDVDPRNGGMDSYEQMKKDMGIDFEDVSGFVVATGGGGLHIYFNVNPPVALTYHLEQYPGIDFKSSGFVVGCGSIHATGAEYESKKGFPHDLNEAPAELIELLRKKETVRAPFSGGHVDVTDSDIASMLAHCRCYDDYEDWVAVGMAVHHATGGDGFKLWDDWSQRSDKYSPDEMGKKWHSFGKSANPVTIGTLIHYAQAGGWVQPVSFGELPESFVVADGEEDPAQLPFDTSFVDLKRPPGFVGKLVAWMNGNSWDEPLEHLNAITAITAMGNIIGLHTTDDVSGVSANLMTLCIAESSAGKETVQQSFNKIMDAAGLGGAVAGDIKSKQEIVRNLIEHQACFYMADELGEILTVIENAKKRGGAAYLEGTTGLMMNAFTKANSHLKVTGDTRRDLIHELNKELSACMGKVKEQEDADGRFQRRATQIEEMIPIVKTQGLPKPFLSLIGYSVPDSMEVILTEAMAKNGFLSRAFMAVEHNDNPAPLMDATGPKPLPEPYARTIMGLAANGNSDVDARIEYTGKKFQVPTTEEGRAMMASLRQWQFNYANLHRETTGFTPVIRRFWEMVGKVSLILAAPERMRTAEHIIWAAAFVKADIDRKIAYVEYARSKTSENSDEVVAGVKAIILQACQAEGGEVLSVVLRKATRRKGVSKDDVLGLIHQLVDNGTLVETEFVAGNRKVTKRYETA